MGISLKWCASFVNIKTNKEENIYKQYFIPVTAMRFEIPLSNKWAKPKGVKLAFQLQRQRL